MSGPGSTGEGSARQGSAEPGSGLNLDWAGYLRGREVRRALAAARLGDAPAGVREGLETLLDLQDALRARRLPLARRALGRYRESLEELEPEGAFPLRASADPTRLEAALGALEAADRDRVVEPEALEARLTPALGEAFTRAEALNTLGVLHALQERPQQASSAFAGALEADAGHYRALTNLGNMALEGGDPAEAERLYRQAIGLNADYAGAQHNLGVALRRQGRLGESVRYVRSGQRLSVRQIRRDQDDSLRANPANVRAVQLVRAAVLVLVVLAVLLLLRGRL